MQKHPKLQYIMALKIHEMISAESLSVFIQGENVTLFYLLLHSIGLITLSLFHLDMYPNLESNYSSWEFVLS